MLRKFGNDPDKLREYYRELKRKSMLHPNNQKGTHVGGFSNVEFAKWAGAKGHAIRYGKNDTTDV
jgi:DNA-binding FadR family transcriptional regulator